jgi:hypothetical protein
VYRRLKLGSSDLTTRQAAAEESVAGELRRPVTVAVPLL